MDLNTVDFSRAKVVSSLADDDRRFVEWQNAKTTTLEEDLKEEQERRRREGIVIEVPPNKRKIQAAKAIREVQANRRCTTAVVFDEMELLERGTTYTLTVSIRIREPSFAKAKTALYYVMPCYDKLSLRDTTGLDEDVDPYYPYELRAHRDFRPDDDADVYEEFNKIHNRIIYALCGWSPSFTMGGWDGGMEKDYATRAQMLITKDDEELPFMQDVVWAEVPMEKYNALALEVYERKNNKPRTNPALTVNPTYGPEDAEPMGTTPIHGFMHRRGMLPYYFPHPPEEYCAWTFDRIANENDESYIFDRETNADCHYTSSDKHKEKLAMLRKKHGDIVHVDVFIDGAGTSNVSKDSVFPDGKPPPRKDYIRNVNVSVEYRNFWQKFPKGAEEEWGLFSPNLWPFSQFRHIDIKERVCEIDQYFDELRRGVPHERTTVVPYNDPQWMSSEVRLKETWHSQHREFQLPVPFHAPAVASFRNEPPWANVLVYVDSDDDAYDDEEEEEEEGEGEGEGEGEDQGLPPP